MYRCPNCGGDMVFSPEKQKLVCGYCDSEFNVEEFDEKKGVNADEHDNIADREPEDKYYQATIFTCPQCGGELISTSDTAATFCSFCGASVLLESRISKEMKPDLIIPFQKSKEECVTEYKKMLGRAWFAPSAMKKDSEIEKFRSIYMPYWIYSYDYDGPLRVKGKTSRRSGDYIYTKHYNIVSNIKVDYDGISFDASSTFADNLSEAVAPFDIKGAQEFKTGYMTGHYADTKDLNADVYEPDAAETVRNHAASELYDKADYSKYGADTSDIAISFEPALKEIRLGFFPVWFLSGRNKKGDRVSYAVMNGQTGKIAADLPVAFSKYLIGSLILAAVLYLITTFVIDITLTPTIVLGLSMAFGLISIIILNMQMNRVYTRDNNLDDKGWQALQGRAFNKTKTIKTKSGKKVDVDMKEVASGIGTLGYVAIAFVIISVLGITTVAILPVILVIVILRAVIRATSKSGRAAQVYPAPAKDKIKTLVKPVIGMAAAGIVLIIRPPSDIVNYGFAVASLLLVAWSYKDIISAHNQLTQRKLPQLGARGGDEDA